MAPLPSGLPRLAIGTLNICNVMGFRIAQEVQVVDLGGFNLMVLTKTNISMTAYFRNQIGYNMVCSTAHSSRAGGEQGVVVLVLQD